jgi:predicted RNA-binding Zn-ribbon protein involved in translation (DUF1610 family)
LGPIDAQLIFQGKRFSADAFLEGFEKIKEEITKTGKLNAAYIPILQNISPGEIQHSRNAQNLSKTLVTNWLENYKFKYWTVHSSNGKPVTQEERRQRAEEIATTLCSQSHWLTHARSINIQDLEDLKVKVTDYSKQPDLDDAITRYYTLLRMTFENTNAYKLFETVDSQIYRFLGAVGPTPTPVQPTNPADLQAVAITFRCTKCGNSFKIQANLVNNMPLQPGNLPYPINDNIFKCPNCGSDNNLLQARLEIEAKTGKKVVG